MGYNSTVLILNDRLHEIRNNPEKFVEEMCDAIARTSPGPGDLGGIGGQRNIRTGQATVMTCTHADNVSLLAVGGNHASVLHTVHNGGKHYTPEAKEDLLRKFADEMGFYIVSRRTAKK